MSLLTHRRVLQIAVPIVLSNLTVPLLGLVDTGVVGQLHGAQLHRLRCYVEAIERNAQRERA